MIKGHLNSLIPLIFGPMVLPLRLRSTRMALQVDAWNGRVVTMEMDPVNATSRLGDRGWNVETPSPWIVLYRDSSKELGLHDGSGIILHGDFG